jgi:hypothetical protein
MYDNTQEMGGALAEHLTSDIQMKLYRGTVLTVLEECKGELDIDMQVMYDYLIMVSNTGKLKWTFRHPCMHACY